MLPGVLRGHPVETRTLTSGKPRWAILRREVYIWCEGDGVLALLDCVLEVQDGKKNMKNRLGAVMLSPILALLMVGAALSILAQPADAEWVGGWISEPAMGEERAQGAFVCSPEGIVYVMGGYPTTAGSSVPNSGAYNTSSGDWAVLDPMPRGARGNTGAMGLDGLVYVFSGWNNTAGALVPETQIFDPVTGTWSLGADIPIPVWNAAAATGSDGRIWIVGGWNLTSETNDCVQVYDPAADSWDNGSAIPSPVVAGAMVSDGSYLYYAGGGSGGSGSTAALYRYNISADEWTSLAPIPAPRSAHALVIGPDDQLYLMGGSDSWSNTGGAVYDTTYVYDIETDEWSSGPSLATARKYLGGGFSVEGEVFAVGGNDGASVYPVAESLQLYVFSYEVELSSLSVRAGDSLLVTVDSHFLFIEEMSSQLEWYLISESGTYYGGNWQSNPTPGPMSFEVPVPELAEPGNFTFLITWFWSSADVTGVLLEDLEYPLVVLPAEPLEDMISDLELQISDAETQLAALEAALAILQTQVGDLDYSMAASEAALAAEIAALEASLQSAIYDLDAAMDGLEAAMESGDEDLMDEISALQDEISALMADLEDLQGNLNGTQNSVDDVQDSVDDVQASVDNKMDGVLGYAIIGLLAVVILLMVVMMVMGRKPKAPAPLPEPPID